VTSSAQDITELKSGYKWPSSEITYSFLTDYPPYGSLPGMIEPGGPVLLSAAQQAATRALFDYIETLIPVHFVNVPQVDALNQIGDMAIGMSGKFSGTEVGITDLSLGGGFPGGGDVRIR